MARTLAYLGPAGTFTEEAALLHDPKAQLISFPSISAVAAAVDTGMVEEGVVAIENSLEGSVTDTLDILIHESKVSIRKELVLSIDHCLLSQPGAQADEVKVIYSHPQALAQCRRFLERCFPKAQAIAALSTADAVEEMLASIPLAAAIATRRAASIYGAELLAQRIQDQAYNVTRFIVLGATDHPRTGIDKTSLCFDVLDRPGALVDILIVFSQRNINLSKIESRPSKHRLGKYFFLVDLDGHREDLIVAEALSEVKSKTAMLKVFGSYPRYQDTGNPFP